MTLCLPSGYSPRERLSSYLDVPSSVIFQPHVYKLAEYLAARAEMKWIVDVGCGSAGKLKLLHEKYSLLGIDSDAGIALAKQTIPGATLIAHDLELGLPDLPDEIVRQAVIVCSDVVEHLRRPEHLMRDLAVISQRAPYVLISTPDRDRARGWLDMGPPANPAHVMEWSGSEFLRFMNLVGFGRVHLHGHTINSDVHRAKTTILTVTGTHVSIEKSVMKKKVAAVIHGFNEADIIPEVFHHLSRQEVEVHYFDNWSTDGTWEYAQSMHRMGKIKHCERFPSEPGPDYEWRDQLDKTASYAKTLDADWVMHHDADEIRVSPWDGFTLRDAISHADQLGFNAIDFTVIDFRFLTSAISRGLPYEQELTHFEFGRRPGHFLQVKCWKNGVDVDLASSGGHDARFNARKVYPVKFLLKHYPLRSEIQAASKIFKNRIPRFRKEQQAYGWHHQYDKYAESTEIRGWRPVECVPWHPTLFNTEYLVERISGIGLVD